MRPASIITAAAAAIMFAAPAAAQSGRVATLPPQREPAHRPPVNAPPMLRDGSIVIDRGTGYRTAIRSCAAYFATSGRTGSVVRSPQGGLGSAPPGANGLPPAPGLQPTPGAQRTPGVSPAPGRSPAPGAKRRVGVSDPTSTSPSLRPLHSAWRTGGTIYYDDGACYVRDRLGNVQLLLL